MFPPHDKFVVYDGLSCPPFQHNLGTRVSNIVRHLRALRGCGKLRCWVAQSFQRCDEALFSMRTSAPEVIRRCFPQPPRKILTPPAINSWTHSRKKSKPAMCLSLATAVQELLNAAHIHPCKIRHRTARFNQPHRILDRPPYRAQNRQSHHRCPVHSRRTMDEQFRSRLVQRDLRELYPPSKQRRWLWFEIVVGRIPKHLDAMFHSQSGVVELDLHVDDMRDACARHVLHIIRPPDPPPHRNSVTQPSH